MASPYWHSCPHCRQDWSHSIPNPCVELDDSFLRCQSCALSAKPLPEARRIVPGEDVEDGIEEHVSIDGEGSYLNPDELPEEIVLPELTER